MQQDKILKLRDGRSLAYTEHGDFAGKPVFFFHGNPGSRLMRHPDESIPRSVGARVITPDRPGYGLSDYLPGRRLVDFPDDVAQLADALGLERFAVFGVSAGGPYAAACAWKLPQRVTGAAVVSGPAPFDREDAYEGLGAAYTAMFRAARWPAWLLRFALGRQTRAALRDPDKALAGTLERLSPDDRTLLSHPALRAQVMNYRAEAARRGVRGMVREAQILIRPWGFRLEDIQPEVHLWYWEADPAISVLMGRYLQARIPRTVPHFLPAGGHFSVFDAWRDILEALAAYE